MKDDVTLLAGVAHPAGTPWVPFADEALDFLSALSAAVRASTLRREELAAFGFWCRRSHLEALKARHTCALPRLGRGLLFHLAPSNVPALFAYSFAVGLLAGNANLVRLSTRRGETEEALLALLRQVLDRPEHAGVQARTGFVSYVRSDALTIALTAHCDGRVIWGGDETVAAMRALPLSPHAVEVCFPDRWSLALLGQRYLSALDGEALAELAHRFYNDTYLMDQNACSSPQLVVWLTDGGDAAVRRRWWEAVAREAGARYPLGPFQAARKYELFCHAAMTMEHPPVTALERYGGNLVYVARLAQLPAGPTALKGGFGLFFEGEAAGLGDLLPMLSPRVQTLVCAGAEPSKVADFLAQNRARGVDRVVPLGCALEMDTIWDGRDLIAALSRVIG